MLWIRVSVGAFFIWFSIMLLLCKIEQHHLTMVFFPINYHGMCVIKRTEKLYDFISKTDLNPGIKLSKKNSVREVALST